MRDFLLDTQTIRYWYDTSRAEHAAVRTNVEKLRQLTSSFQLKPKLLISVVTLGEIEFGHQVTAATDPEKRAGYIKFVQEQLPNSFELTADSSAAYGELRARLFDKYAPREKRKPGMRPEQLVIPVTGKDLQIQENDLWICAQTLAHGLVLVTNDRMTPIFTVAAGMDPPLLVQNWTHQNAASI